MLYFVSVYLCLLEALCVCVIYDVCEWSHSFLRTAKFLFETLSFVVIFGAQLSVQSFVMLSHVRSSDGPNPTI